VLDLGFDGGAETSGVRAVIAPVVLARRPRVLRASEEELSAHLRRLDALDKSAGGQSIWRKQELEVKQELEA
jgi:DNA polymerase-3 subunit epsilon